MYFRDKRETDIDNEFNNKNNIISNIINFLIKYKIIIGIGIVLLVIIFIFIFIFSYDGKNINKIINNEEYYLVLEGKDVITIYQDSDYIEPGYSAYSSNNDNLNGDVKVTSNINTSVVGEYEIIYMIDNVVKKRKVLVIEKPKVYTFIKLNTVDNKIDIYLKLGEKYIEPGYNVFSTTGMDLNNKVVVSGNVDTSKKGKYQLTYSFVDENGVTISVSRLVTVMDTEIDLFLNNSGYTNKDVSINVLVDDEYFDYMILPDGSKINKNSYLYVVSSNGKYTFKTYSTKGVVKEKSIEVKNIDKVMPSGSCSGSFENGKSVININASDNIGIKKYVIDGVDYSNNKITINKEIKNALVKIYDNAGNIKEISCSLKDNNKAILFDKNIKLNYSFVKDNRMWYALYTPNVDNGNKKVPLIVWLHGSGEVGLGESTLKNSGLLAVINNWTLEGFNAYVLCPRLSGGGWMSTSVRDKLFSIMDEIILKENIDTKKIIIAGHSLGGIGVQYMAFHGQKYFSSMVMLSGYNANIDLTQIKDMPVKAYTETSGSSYTFTMGKFANVFGKDNITVLNAGHSNIPKVAFNEDKNGDGRSDLIEWMLLQEKK